MNLLIKKLLEVMHKDLLYTKKFQPTNNTYFSRFVNTSFKKFSLPMQDKTEYIIHYLK